MMDKHKTAKKKLQEILQMTNQGQAHEVSQILVYNGLSLNNYDDVQNFSYQSCKSLDGLNCWLSLQLQGWSSLPTKLKDNSLIHSNLEPLSDKYLNNTQFSEFKNNIFVNQSDIEELDNNLIQLVP